MAKDLTEDQIGLLASFTDAFVVSMNSVKEARTDEQLKTAVKGMSDILDSEEGKKVEMLFTLIEGES